MKSIYFRNFLSTALMVLMSFLIIGVALIFLGQNFIISSHRDDMKSNAEIVSGYIKTVDVDDYPNWETRISLSVASGMSGNDIFLTNSDGLIVSCSDDPGKCSHIGRRIDAAYMYELQSKGELNTVSDLGGIFPSQRYIYAMPVPAARATSL